MLLTAVALLGFASSPGGGPDPVDAVCADTPDRTMIGITGGSTCSDLAGEGRCTSTDGLVAKVMEMNCKASCGGCGETPASRAYVVGSDEPGDYMCKEQVESAIPFKFLSKEAAEEKVCGTADYIEVTTGVSCAESGHGIIWEKDECSGAAAALGLSDVTATSYQNGGPPSGCFYSNNAYVPYLGNLVINTDGRMMGSCSTTNRCICVNMCEARICK